MVSLDDQAKIRASEYPSFEAVEKDIEHCFVNAKRCAFPVNPSHACFLTSPSDRNPLFSFLDNVKGSIIFSDAKVLHVSLRASPSRSDRASSRRGAQPRLCCIPPVTSPETHKDDLLAPRSAHSSGVQSPSFLCPFSCAYASSPSGRIYARCSACRFHLRLGASAQEGAKSTHKTPR